MKAATLTARSDRAAASRDRSRGQVIVIFAGSMLLLMMMTAIVVDISWYWVNSLRVQRAADAAALAGAVMLPKEKDHAYQLAWEEASKNGFPNGGGITVTPLQDDTNELRLNVTIRAPIGTFFMRVVGIEAIPVTRSSKAEFTLPVPMGSPQNYYGVGFYEGLVTPPPTNQGGQTPAKAATDDLSTAADDWDDADQVEDNDNDYATEDRSGDRQQWRDFNLLNSPGSIPDDGSLVIETIDLMLQDVSLTGSGTSNNCRVSAELSWNAGTNWTTVLQSSALDSSQNSDRTITFVNPSPRVPSGAHTWIRSEFSDTNLRVRLTWVDGETGCSSSRSVRLDQLQVSVNYHTLVTPDPERTTLGVPNPSGGTLASQGFWGAIFTSGGWRENGDRYATSRIGSGTGVPSGNPNPDYDADGYDYLIEVGPSGQVQLFDPIFCATGDNGHGGSLGTGDHWTDPTAGHDHETNFAGGPVSVTYTLYDTKGTPANDTDDGSPVRPALSYDPGTKTLGDFSGNFGTPQNDHDPDRQDCTTNPAQNAAHNKWVVLAQGLLAGTYRLNVNTSIDPTNMNTGAENLFSIWVGAGSGNTRAYGNGRMAAYTNLDGGNQAFYFAQIEKVHAGKQLEIQLFDPGESEGDAFVRFLSPDGNNYHRATFDWVSDDGRSGKGVTQLQTSNDGALFNNRLITITIDLGKDYGKVGLNPPGDITTEQGWWRVEYNISEANDTTTWGVTIKGNPVHLVLP